MVVLHTCMNLEDPIKNKGARELTPLYVVFSEAKGQLTPKSVVEFCQNSNQFKLLSLSSLPAGMKKNNQK